MFNPGMFEESSLQKLRTVDLRREEEYHLFELVKEEFLQLQDLRASPLANLLSNEAIMQLHDKIRLDARLLCKLLKEPR